MSVRGRRAAAPAVARAHRGHRRDARRLARAAPLLACAWSALALGACDSSFEPIAEGDVHFSVFGYLDAAADTQWIRVMPVRPLMTTSPDSFGATVTLEELGTGRVIALRDSVLGFSHHADAEVDAVTAYVHDFWTTEPIRPGATYRFATTRGGDDPAEAVVEVPADYAVEVWIEQLGTGAGDRLRIVGSKHVPFLRAFTHFTDRCGVGLDSVRYDAVPDEEGLAVIPIRRGAVRPRENCGPPTVGSRELWIVGSESAWPQGEAYSPWGLAAPERASNVSNAVGFLGGVFTKVVPWESCAYDGGVGPVPEYCVLRYDEASATVTGTITESRCADGAIDSVTVQLRELVEPPTAPRIRTVVSDAAGAFSFGALEPGMHYLLHARAKPVPIFGEGEIDIYAQHTDTLTSSPGERMRYDIALPRLTPCDQKP